MTGISDDQVMAFSTIPDDIADFIAYDPASGVFTSIKQRRRCKVGDVLGTFNGNGYIRIAFRGKNYLAHRVAWRLMTGEWPVSEVDHRDLDRSNNRWANLRESTQSQNCGNAPRTKRSTTGFKGVTLIKKTGRYQAYIGIAGRQKHLGYFDTAEEAHFAYISAARVHFGEFARAA